MLITRINKEIIYPDLSYRICGLCFGVHNSLGRYLNEKQYADRLEEVLKKNNINYAREIKLPPSFEGERIGRNIADFVIEDKIIVDLKAKSIILKEDYFQMQRYLIS